MYILIYMYTCVYINMSISISIYVYIHICCRTGTDIHFRFRKKRPGGTYGHFELSMCRLTAGQGKGAQTIDRWDHALSTIRFRRWLKSQ